MISLVRVLLVVIAKNEHFDEMLWVNIYIYRLSVTLNFTASRFVAISIILKKI